MNKSLSSALVAAGILLTMSGIHASEAFGLDAYWAFPAIPADPSLSLRAGGIGLAVLGYVLLGRASKS